MAEQTEKQIKLALLPGDGIGPEVMEQAVAVLEVVRPYVKNNYQTDIQWQEALMGGIAVDETGSPLPEETLQLCKQSDAVVLAAVGGPKWDNETHERRPETGLLSLRKELGVFANLRPLQIWPQLADRSPLRQEVIGDGVDILMYRELTGGLYFGQPRGRRALPDGETEATDTLTYTGPEVRRIARLAFEAARRRKGKVSSIDKANVLESSRLWREQVDIVAQDYPDVTVEHQLVDSTAMRLVARPTDYDVLVTENMFGDILSDLGGGLAGTLGMLPSASLGEGGPGLYEPVHGSAPDIAGQDKANPMGIILSLGMMFEHSFNMVSVARAIEETIGEVLEEGYRTGDIARPGEQVSGTAAIGEVICSILSRKLA